MAITFAVFAAVQILMPMSIRSHLVAPAHPGLPGPEGIGAGMRRLHRQASTLATSDLSARRALLDLPVVRNRDFLALAFALTALCAWRIRRLSLS
jgi:hypothetical protein